jgi:mercuric ion transport protein
MKSRAAHRWQAFSAAMPGVGVSILVAAQCPACWLAYAGLLTMPGVAWLLGETSLMLLTVGLLGVALVSLAYRAHARRGYRPLALAIVAASLILIEKWALSSPWLLALGLALLVGASLWNAWPRAGINPSACAACAPHASGGPRESAPSKG